MKTWSKSGWLALVAGLGLSVMAHGELFLIDFGTSASFRGASVTSPDVYGRTWNGFAPGDFLSNLVNSSNRVSTFDLSFTTALATDSYNGPAGVTTQPPTPAELAATVFDADALGELGVTNAVFDYIEAATNTPARMVLSQLDPSQTYAFTFYASRKYPVGEVAGDEASRTTVFSVTTSNGTVLASTSLVVGAFGDHNSNAVVTLSGLSPDLYNRIYVTFGGLTTSNAGYLNALKMETRPPTVPPADETILIDLGSSASFNGASVANPDGNGNFWNSVWSGAFSADLVNTSNTATSVDLGFDTATGTDNFNGPAGAVDAAALGALGGATNAVNDYYVSSSFQLQGLNPFRRYNLTFFGSHKFSINETTVYTVYSDASYTQAVASARLNVQVPGTSSLPNSNTVAVITNLAPQSGNALYIKFEGALGSFGYLNALKVDVYIPDLTYDEWASDYPGLGSRTADDDNDGLANLAEFGLGGNPTNNLDTGLAPSFRMTSINGTNQYAYAYARRAGDSGLTYHLELTTNLVGNSWTNAGYTEVPTTTVLNAQFDAVTNLIPLVESRAFIRLVIEEP